MKNERKKTKNITKKIPMRMGTIRNHDKINKNNLEENNKSQLKPAEFPEAIALVIINKIISIAVRQNEVKEKYSKIGNTCFSYLKELINPFLATQYLDYENGLDNLEIQKNKINYRTIVTEKVNTWTYIEEPNTPGLDRYSSGFTKLISFKFDNEDNIENYKSKELKGRLSMQRKSALIKEVLEINKPLKNELNKKIKQIKRKKRKKKKQIDIIKTKEEEMKIKEEEEKKIMNEVFLALPCEDLPKEKYENKYALINNNEENNNLRKEREYLIQKKIELKEIQYIQKKRDKLKQFQDRIQKNFDGSKQTFDSEGKLMIIHSPQVDNLINEFNFINVPNIANKEKQEKRISTIKSPRKSRISRLSKININEKKNFDKLPEDMKQIFNYIKNILLPKWLKTSYMNIPPKIIDSNEGNITKRKSTFNKSFKAFFGPFLKKYIFKNDISRNPKDSEKNNIIYFRNIVPKRKLLYPSGSNFNLLRPETGVVIEDKSSRKSEVKDGGFEYIKKYNKPSMYEFSKLVMESSNLNSLNSRALSSSLIESKINEINEIKNRNKFSELNKDDYNGYIFEFSDNTNPLFQNALSLNDKEKNNEDNNENKDSNEINTNNENDKYKDKNIFRAMEEGYLKNRYNSVNSLNFQDSIQLKRNINNLYHYFEDDGANNIKINADKKITKNYSALRVRRKNNNTNIINDAPLPKIKVQRINSNKREIREFKNKIRGRKIINRFNFRILKNKKWGENDEKDENNRQDIFRFENDLLKRVGENIMERDDNRIKRHLIKSASAENIF